MNVQLVYIYMHDYPRACSVLYANGRKIGWFDLKINNNSNVYEKIIKVDE